MEQGISKLSLDKGNKLKVIEAYQERGYCVYVEKKRKMMKCEEGFSSYVWKGVHGKCVCKNQTWKEVVCSKYL